MINISPGLGIATITLVVVSSLTGCDSSTLKVPKLDPAAASEKAMKDLDTSGDGVLDPKELEKAPGLAAALKSIDKDGDGMLSKDEIANRIKVYWQDQIAMMPMTCVVTLDGQPLGGATVTIIPESFLGSEVKVASGVTDAHGITGLSFKGNEGSGVQCGLYRVQISKKDAGGRELVPSKFNSATTLGQEISIDVPDIERGIKFALSSR